MESEKTTCGKTNHVDYYAVETQSAPVSSLVSQGGCERSKTKNKKGKC
jgi:hypothetical protein